MFQALPHPYLVPFDGTFRVAEASTEPPADAPGKKACKERLAARKKELHELQRMMYAQDSWSVLLVFQAMDAAGKDGTIRHVLTGVNPAGCQVVSFKAPSIRELDHDYLWRTAMRLPQRGCIGVFNRSYYEEVLVVRVHPEFLDAQRLPRCPEGDTLWQERFRSIREHEEHLARNGTAVIKFWLNVSKEEQRRRFLSRLDTPEKNWKFNASDLTAREQWDAYMKAYEEALNATSRPWAPWYAIPADSKRFMRLAVAEILAASLQSLGLAYPTVDDADRSRLRQMRARLEAEK